MVAVFRPEVSGPDDLDEASGSVARGANNFYERGALVHSEKLGVMGIRVDRPKRLFAGVEEDPGLPEGVVKGEVGVGGGRLGKAHALRDVGGDQGAVDADLVFSDGAQSLDAHEPLAL